MTALVLAFLLSTPPQDPAPPQPPGPAPAEDPLLASDGRPIAPGRLPEDTTAGARDRWAKVLGATYAGTLPTIRSFDLLFDVRSRRPGAKNQLEVGIAYLEAEHPRAPFVRLFLQRKDLVSIHGPDGSWLQDGETVLAMAGREFAEDLRQLREYRTLAGNLLGLVQPNRLRLVSLRALEVVPTPDEEAWSARRVSFQGAEPLDLPDEKLTRLARKYAWVELRSPDLRVYQGGGEGDSTVYRGRLAIDPGSGEVRLAVLHAEAPDGSPLPTHALLVEVRSYAELPGGYRLPRHFFVKEIDPSTHPLTFFDRDGTELGLIVRDSAINPEGLTVSAFERPR